VPEMNSFIEPLATDWRKIPADCADSCADHADQRHLRVFNLRNQRENYTPDDLDQVEMERGEGNKKAFPKMECSMRY